MASVLPKILLLALLNCLTVDGANILFLSAIPSPSHSLWNFRLIQALDTRGHNITVVIADKPKVNLKNTHILNVAGVYDALYANNTIDLEALVDPNSYTEVQIYHDFMHVVCQGLGSTEGFQTLLNYPNDFKFDLIIHDFTCGNCLLGFLHKFNYPPLIGVSAYKYTTQLIDMVGGHHFTSYIPRPVLPLTSRMSFCQRVQNLALMIYESMYHKYYYQSKYDKTAREIFHIPDLPSVENLGEKHAIILLNTHPALDFPFPLPPNIIEVSGLQIGDPKPLPKDLETFISKSKIGAILIAFGTNVHADVFDEKKQSTLLEVVKKFPDYNFLWKFETDISNGKVPNFLVKSWLPQNDILAHPKVKAFVSHGGGLSTQEAVWYGVPVIAIPFFMDQKTNTHAFISAGVAVKVDITTFNAKDLENAIRTILEDRSYEERMKLQSKRFKDRPMKPLDIAVWWVEYILRDPNPTHLRSPVLDLGQWKANLYDILLYCFILSVLVTYGICKCTCKVCKRFTQDNTQKSKIKVN